MAQTSDLAKRLSVVWDTQRPFLERGRSSSSFSLWGFTWNLEISYYYKFQVSRYFYGIHLRRRRQTENLKMNFRVTTFIEDKHNCSSVPLCCSRIVQSTDQVIWEFDGDEVSKKIPGFETHGEWRVVCLFHDTAPSMLQTENETVNLSTQTDMNVSPDLENLSLDFSSLLENKVFPDVKLRCGGRTISAHRSVLAGRSEVFAAMFESKMVERKTGCVDVTDVDFPILELLLKYVYSGKIADISDDTALSLYAAGDKYAIHALRKACSDWMTRNMTEENCISFLTVADVHSDAEFKDAACSFINRHTAVLHSETWLRFVEDHPVLANETYRSFVLSVRDRNLFA